MFPMMMFSRVSAFLSSDFELSPDSLLSSSFLPGNGEKSRQNLPLAITPCLSPHLSITLSISTQLPPSPSHPATLIASAFPSLPH
ncbi:unnamed protein product [Arctogadus glacialis]